MSITRLKLRTRIREIAEQEATDFITDAMLNAWIDSAHEELYDRVVAAFQDHFWTTEDFTLAGLTVAGATHALPAGLRYFRMLEKNPDTTSRIIVTRWELGEKDRLDKIAYRLVGSSLQIEPFEISAGCYRLYYVPLVSAFTQDSDVVDSRIEHWSDFIIYACAIKCKSREESDTSDLRVDLDRVIKRIDQMAQFRDAGAPPRCNDVYETWDVNACADGSGGEESPG